MYSDMHYLIPADAYINQLRSNYPYAERFAIAAPSGNVT
jgi:endonuclease I